MFMTSSELNQRLRVEKFLARELSARISQQNVVEKHGNLFPNSGSFSRDLSFLLGGNEFPSLSLELLHFLSKISLSTCKFSKPVLSLIDIIW